LVGSIFHMTRKIVSEMTYNVSMETLNPTIPYHTIIARYIQQGHSHIYNYNHTVICAICRFSCRRSFHANLTTSSTLNVILTACEMELTQTWSVCSFCLITTVDMFFMFKVAVYQILLNEYE